MTLTREKTMANDNQSDADSHHDDLANDPADMPIGSEKVQKVLARAGLASRRAIEEWILAGRVRINDRSAHIGDRIDEGDRIFVDGQVPEISNHSRLLLFVDHWS